MIGLGLRLAVSGGREAAVRLVILAVAVGLGVGLLLTALSATGAVKAQNAKLQEKFGVEGLPMLVVLSPNEKVVFTQEGYKEGGPDAFLAQFPNPGN